MRLHRAFAFAVIVVLSGGRLAMAQSVREPLGMDVFVGGIGHPDPATEETQSGDFSRMGGWQAGASLRAGHKLQWLGFTGSYGSHSNDEARVREVLGGLRATSPWLIGSNVFVRAFGHVLTGYQWSQTISGVEDAGPALVAGGGIDIMIFFRIQVDYVHANLTGVQKGYTRSFVGAVVPLCFAGCRPDWKDGIPLPKVADRQ